MADSPARLTVDNLSDTGQGKGHYGMPNPGTRRSLYDRLNEKIDRSGGRKACWPWLAATSTNGYGLIGAGGERGRTLQAHRVAWEQANGPIPAGKDVLHRCDNRPCCNPAHLFLGTQLVNMRDMMRKKRNAQPHGEANGAARVTAQVVRVWRRRMAVAGPGRRGKNRYPSYLSIAREYGVDRSTVTNAVTGKTWRHVR